MRREAVEEDDVAGLRRHGVQREPGFVQRVPFLADQPFAVPARHHFEAAILQRRRVDRHQGGDEQRGVAGPAGLLVLMRLEAGGAGHLEVDLLLEQHHRAAHQRSRPL